MSTSTVSLSGSERRTGLKAGVSIKGLAIMLAAAFETARRAEAAYTGARGQGAEAAVDAVAAELGVRRAA